MFYSSVKSLKLLEVILNGYPFIFMKDFRFLVFSFSRLPLNVYSVSIKLICRANELQNRPTKCWFLNTGSSDFDKNIPLNDVRLELGICQEIFGAFYASKCHFLLNFCPLFLHRGIEVAFAF